MVDSDGKLPLPWLAEPLKRALGEVRGHATLLHGPRGAGLFEMAMAMAQGWLCEAADAPKPCGRCKSCHFVQARTHPDLVVLVPDALRERLGWGQNNGEDEGDEPKAKGAKLSRDVKIAAVRAAIGFSQQSSARGRGKVIVIHPAEAMNTVSANALLKTLEEPPGGLRLVLTSASTQSLLPTLRSRCQAIRLDTPDAEQAAAWLREQGVNEPDVLLAASGGEPLTVRDWLSEVTVADAELAQAWRKLPERVARHADATVLAGWPLPRAIDSLVKLCHDAMVVVSGGEPRFFPAGSVPGGASMPELAKWSKALARAARHDEHPWNAPLLIEALVTEGSRAWRAPSLHS